MKSNAAKSGDEFSSSNELVVHHEPLVKRIAYHLMSRLPASVQADDLIQAGMIGLIEASRKFDPEQGASFETYAGIRIRGAMLDEIRRTDWTPRSVHRKAREVAEAVRKIENAVGRDARDVEVAEEMGLSLNEYHKILQDSTGCRIFSFEDPGTLADEGYPQSNRQPNQPLENLQKSDFKQGLAEEIKGLPERERLVMALYYDEELNLREIGEILGVSESRVCQIHGQALIRLRARMGEWLAD
ncbi:MAG: RNA polymerase sigma factor FliA [Gammaproteobacteria bacterium]|nr:RNA polymerase sigma factor FliA [Gammaproteobacteria bacterium]MDH5514910.1 RNA polymerase sigma factor FliA [Gammaproteobacteria bacterium]